MNETYTHIDLFSGIGGFSLGLKQSGFPIGKSYFSEIDKHAISVYRRNFPDAEYLGSVDTISGSGFESGKFIVTFGFPCQDLSVAGKRKGFDGSRSSLFFEAMRIIEELRPDIFIFENVKGFYSSNDGKDFTIALQTIANLGLYECQWQLLNTAWFLPQNRERIYFVGSLGAGSRQKVFPIKEEYPNVNGKRKGFKDGIRVQAIDSNYYKGPDGKRTMIQIGKLRSYGDEGVRLMKNNISPCLKDQAREDGSEQPVICQPVLTPDRPVKKQNGRRIKDNGDPSFNLTSQDRHGVMIRDGRDNRSCLRAGRTPEIGFKGNSIRRLTPIETERLQGFPDLWTQYGHDGKLISDSQRYKMCGNAVSVPVIKAIGERMLNR